MVGGGVGCAIAYPVAKALHENGAQVHSIVGFRTKDLVILQQESEIHVNAEYVLELNGQEISQAIITMEVTEQ